MGEEEKGGEAEGKEKKNQLLSIYILNTESSDLLICHSYQQFDALKIFCTGLMMLQRVFLHLL